jgi:putative ABC transport system permease protein
MSSAASAPAGDGLALSGPEAGAVRPRRLSLGARANLVLEVVNGGLVELWSHKLRSGLTLTLLMLGVFALVVLTSVLDGVLDKVGTGFEGMAWDGTVILQPKEPRTTEEQKRFAMSPGLRYEDLARIAAPYEGALAFLPRATKQTRVRVAGAPSASSSPASRPSTRCS